MLFQLIVMLCISDILEMLKFLTNSTRMYFPAEKLRIINHIDKYNDLYQTLTTISIMLMRLTNSILLESSTWFPIGWLFSGVITIILLHCCSCLKRIVPHVFDIKITCLFNSEYYHHILFIVVLSYSQRGFQRMGFLEPDTMLVHPDGPKKKSFMTG
jgi:hypothetical protein